MAVHFGSRNEWKQKREQAQPLINKIFSEMEKMSRWSEQLRFLILCRRKGIIPKGMRTKLPGISPISDYGRRLKRTHEMKILRRNISVLHGRKAGSDKKISQFKLDLRETFGMSGNFIENTVNGFGRKFETKFRRLKFDLKANISFFWKKR